MSNWKKIHRDIACAHIGDLATRAFRDGDTAKGITLLGCAQEVAYQPHPEPHYREGLARAAGLFADDADAIEQGDAVVAAVLLAEDPHGSLPAQFRALWAAEDKVVRGRRNPFFTPQVGRKPLVERLRALLVANAAHRVLQLLGGAQEAAEIQPLTPEDSVTAEGIFDVVRLREEDHDLVRAVVGVFPRCLNCVEPPQPATFAANFFRYCDACAEKIRRDPTTLEAWIPQPLRYAVELRALLKRMKTWSTP